MKHVTLPGGETVPALGLGTWKMGVGDRDEAEQMKALQTGIDLGLTLIDTAEMYGDGRSEQLVGKVVKGRRDGVFIVSKVLPSNASCKGTIAACERSLRHLGQDRLDLYLLHWRGSQPLADTVAAFEDLKAQGKIRHWGVSNFDVGDMADVKRAAPSLQPAANQVMYSLSARGIEHDLLPQSRATGIAIMAYSPLGEGDLPDHPALKPIAAKHRVTPAAIALAFSMHGGGIISIPKSSRADRVRDNAAAGSLTLDAEDLAALDRAFPPPKRKVPLAVS
jgi:diketogulonate reductase-like aldo/keto reductase